MSRVQTRVKPWIALVAITGLVVLTVLTVATVASGSFRLERADGSRPEKGINLAGYVTGAKTIPSIIIPPAPPRPKPIPASAPVSAPTYASSLGYSDAFFHCLGGRESGRKALPCAAFCGRLQWLPSTWRNAGGGKHASLPQHASWEQEKAVARSYLAGKSTSFLLSQWPPARHCLHLR